MRRGLLLIFDPLLLTFNSLRIIWTFVSFTRLVRICNFNFRMNEESDERTKKDLRKGSNIVWNGKRIRGEEVSSHRSNGS